MKTEGNDAVIAFEGDTPVVGTPQLLLDAAGLLVGVDLGAGGFDRVAIMIGPHESVTETRAARVTVSGNTLRVHGGGALVR